MCDTQASMLPLLNADLSFTQYVVPRYLFQQNQLQLFELIVKIDKQLLNIYPAVLSVSVSLQLQIRFSTLKTLLGN